MPYRLGRKPNDPSKPRIKLAAHLTGATPPPSAHWTDVPEWGMLGNADWGDCTCAGDGHLAELLTFYGQGTETPVSTAQALAAYSAISGFDPNAGPPGENPTDQGATVQDALGYLRKHGIAGVKIAAFAEIRPGNLDAIKTACAELGGLSAGVNLPNNALPQFQAGEVWDVVEDDAGLDGGHCIVLAGYDADYLYFCTWGKIQRATYAWWQKYADEIWAVVSTDWCSAKGADPEGVNLASLGDEFAELTGEPSPFNGSPVPAPAPDPAGLLAEAAALVRQIAASADRDIAEAVAWFHSHGL